jgi:hypothetical protein
MTEGDQNLLIALGGLLLSGLTYFAGVQRGKRDTAVRQHQEKDLAESQQEHERALERERQREARVTAAVERYADLYQRGISSAIYGLADSGLGLLHSDEEIRQAVDRMHQITRDNPWGTLGHHFDKVDLLTFFKFVSERRINFANQSVEQVIEQMKREGRFGERSA